MVRNWGIYMDKVVRSSKSITYTILDGIMSTVILLISIAAVDNLIDGFFSPYNFIILFFAMAGLRVVQGALSQEKKKNGLLRLLIGGGFYLITAIVLIIWGINEVSCLAVMVIYLLDIIVGRVFCIIEGKRLIGRIFNALLCIFLAYAGISTIFGEEIDIYNILLVLLVVIVIRSLLHIIALSFSQIQLDVLMKIIRRTYALEILFGLMMLIGTFSYVLSVIEDGIKDFWDGLWYCFAIVTTIGFGDITATSIVGRALSVILGIYGIIVVSMVTSIIINFYGEMKDIQDKEREEEHAKRLKKKKKKKKAAAAGSEAAEDTEEDTEETEETEESETEEESGADDDEKPGK